MKKQSAAEQMSEEAQTLSSQIDPTLVEQAIEL